MNDETKAALKYFRSNLESGDFVSGREEDAVKALLAHIDGEPERLAAARREAAEAKAEEGVRYWTDLAQAEARDAAALRTRVAELEAQLSKAEARVAELDGLRLQDDVLAKRPEGR